MFKKKTFLAIIPARGGSKRLKNKNILPLNGIPLIAHTIKSAKKSKYIDEIVVTSDSKEILNISKKYKISTVKRPKNLALDTSTTFDAIKHTIKKYKNINKDFDYIILLQPTSPLRTSKDINKSIKLLFKNNANAIVSITEPLHSPLWSFKANKNKKLDSIFINKDKFKRSQELDKYYNLNGAIYICKNDLLLKNKSFLITDKIYGYEMNQKNSIDIDTIIDFKLAEILLGDRNGK